MAEWWPLIKGRKRWRGCDEVGSRRRAGETGSEELLARTIGPSEYNGRIMECNVLLDRTFAGLGERGIGLWKAATETSPKSVKNER